MKIKDSIKSIVAFLELQNLSVDLELLEESIKLHEDYPSLLTYIDVLMDFGIKCIPLKVSEEDIKNLPSSFLTLIQDTYKGYFLACVSENNLGRYLINMEQSQCVSLHSLKNLWLGLAIVKEEKQSRFLNANNIENKIPLINGKSSGTIVGMRNSSKFDDIEFNNIYFDIIGNDNQIIIEKGTDLLNCKIKIRGNKNYLYINKNCRIRGNFILEGGSSKIIIGKETTMEYVTLSATESKNIKIGSDCMFSNDINILTSDSHSIIDRITKKRLNYPKDVVIENHVWIATKVNVLKGVTIKSNSIIGINSIVTHDVPSNSIYGGSPAQIIKTNINWSRNLLP